MKLLKIIGAKNRNMLYPPSLIAIDTWLRPRMVVLQAPWRQKLKRGGKFYMARPTVVFYLTLRGWFRGRESWDGCYRPFGLMHYQHYDDEVKG